MQLCLSRRISRVPKHALEDMIGSNHDHSSDLVFGARLLMPLEGAFGAERVLIGAVPESSHTTGHIMPTVGLSIEKCCCHQRTATAAPLAQNQLWAEESVGTYVPGPHTSATVDSNNYLLAPLVWE